MKRPYLLGPFADRHVEWLIEYGLKRLVATYLMESSGQASIRAFSATC